MRFCPAIIGVGFTELQRHSSKTAAQVAAEAAVRAISDAGLRSSDIDGYVGCFEAANPSARHYDGVDEVSAQYLCKMLDLKNVRIIIDLPQSALAIGLIKSAHSAVISRDAKRILILRAMVQPPNVKYALNSKRVVGGDDQFSLPFGLGKGGGVQALWWRRYLHKYNLEENVCFPVIANARRNAKSNSRAYWREAKIPSEEEYSNSRYVYSPLRVLDCDIPVTGAIAMVMADGDLRSGFERAAAYVHGFATRRQSFASQVSYFGANYSEVEAWQIYDGFSVLLIDAVERLGLCGKGEGTYFMKSVYANGPSSFVNSFGGSLGEGRMHGMGHLLAAVESVTSCNKNVHPLNLVAADIGMWDIGGSVLLGREPIRLR